MAINFDYLGSVAEATTPVEYTLSVYRAALLYYEKEVEALETLNHLEAIQKVSRLLRLDPHVLTLFVDHGEDAFENVLRQARDFNPTGSKANSGCGCGSHNETTTSTVEPPMPSGERIKFFGGK